MLITLLTFPTAIQEGPWQYEEQCQSYSEVKGQIYLEASHQKLSLEAAERDRGAFMLLNLFFKWIMNFSMKALWVHISLGTVWNTVSLLTAPSKPHQDFTLFQVTLLKTRSSLREHFKIFTKCTLEEAVWCLSNPKILSSWKICLLKYIIPDD